MKPQISEGGVVRLAIYQELSSIQNTLTAAQGGIITNKRSFESSVLVEDGNIVVLGGLIEDRTDNSKSQVPVLGEIPFVGGLFRYENRGRRKTNLLVFLRPYVVRDESTSSSLALDRYDYIRGQVAAGTLPDNMIFRDLQGRQLPATPAVPPTMRRQQEGAGCAGRRAPAPGASLHRCRARPKRDLAPRERRSRLHRSLTLLRRADPPPRPAPPPSAPTLGRASTDRCAASGCDAHLAWSLHRRRRQPTPLPSRCLHPRRASVDARVPDRPRRYRLPPPAPPDRCRAARLRRQRLRPIPAPARRLRAAAGTGRYRTPFTASQSRRRRRHGGAIGRQLRRRAPRQRHIARPAPRQSGSSTLLQVAAVSDIARGRDLQRQLRAAGMDAYWESVRTKQGTDVVRVRVTVDPATQTMADAIAKLKAMGFDPIIVTP